MATAFYELLSTSDGKWLLCRVEEGCPPVAVFNNKLDAIRALSLFEKSEQSPKPLIDADEAKKEFDRAFTTAHSRNNASVRTTVSGYDHQLDDRI